VAAMLLSVANASAQDCDYSGTTGQLQWCLKNGTLTISGEGVMPDYGIDLPPDVHPELLHRFKMTMSDNSPWYEYRESIHTVVLENGVTSIGNNAFYSCVNLTSITIPNSVKKIELSTCLNCLGLTTINVESENNTYASEDGVLFNKDKSALIRYPAGKTTETYVIPNSVKKIEHFAFLGCKSLTSITIPINTKEFGSFALFCENLTSITNLNPKPVKIKNLCVFSSSDRVIQSTCVLKVPKNSVSAYKKADIWKEFNIVGLE